MRPWAFYQNWLDIVSRSFALCIPQLAPPFRDQVGLAYLMFRVLDTIEDAPFADPAVQQRQFERLRGFLHAMPAPRMIETFVETFPTELTEGERGLLGQTSALLADAHGLPPGPRAAMFRALDRMAQGMAAYMRRPAPLRLVDGDDVARYCCFVAGVVGEMLTELWALDRRAAPPTAHLAYHFGLFLQKTNILKDQREDEAAGRFLVPDRGELLASLARDADAALGYLQAIPRGDSYRVFLAWSLMLGAATIGQLGLPKVSRRAESAQLLARTATIAHDNEALARQLADLMPTLPRLSNRGAVKKPESFEWFRRTLAAPLTDADLLRLGVRA